MVAGTAYRMRFINITPVDSDLTYSIVDAAGAPATWRPIAKDGKDLPPQQAAAKPASGDTITVGETRDYLFTSQKEGERYLQAASFQRMWVRATLIVSPQALRPLLDQWNEIGSSLPWPKIFRRRSTTTNPRRTCAALPNGSFMRRRPTISLLTPRSASHYQAKKIHLARSSKTKRGSSSTPDFADLHH